MEEVLKKCMQLFRCVFKDRGPGNRRAIIIGLLLISVISHMERSGRGTGLLFAEKMFDWSVVDYTNFTAYAFTIIGLRYKNYSMILCQCLQISGLKCYSKLYRTFITTPILCYFLGIHDCMLAITGGMASITGAVTTVSKKHAHNSFTQLLSDMLYYMPAANFVHS